jgi:hypothetical protein
MVALPLVQVLRYQNAELSSLLSEKAGLDPVAQAVGAQRSLSIHRTLSAQVLRGALDKEVERKLRQAEVDERVTLLGTAVQGTAWDRAEAETLALRDDWAVLARQIAARSIGAGESDQGHRQLIEQVLQVIDFIADEEPVNVGSGTPAERAVLAAALALPRLAAQLAALSGPAFEGGGAAFQRSLAETEATLARTLGALDRALDAAQGATADRITAANGLPVRDLARASAAAGASAERYFAWLRSQATGTHAGDHTAQLRTRPADAALQASLALFELSQGSVKAALSLRIEGLERTRGGLLLAMALLGLAALALLASLSRGLRREPAPQPPEGTSAQVPGATGGSQAEAGRVMQRLRVPGLRASEDRTERNRGDAQPTIPPEP